MPPNYLSGGVKMARNQKGEPFGNFFRVSHGVLESEQFKQLPVTAKLLYIYLCKLRNRLAKDNGEFFRSDTILERDTGLSNFTIRKAKRLLDSSGLIRFNKPKQRNKATRYTVEEYSNC
jgi:hypothetical protein